MSVRLIGISGKLGSGKDTMADLLVAEYGYEKHCFADKVKEIAAIICGIPRDQAFTREVKSQPMLRGKHTFGEVLQFIGTGMREWICPDVWLMSVLDEWDGRSRWVIPDVRYINEVEAIRNLGGVIVRVEGDPVGIREHNKDKRDLFSKSETELDHLVPEMGFDHVVFNNGSLEKYKYSVRATVKRIVFYRYTPEITGAYFCTRSTIDNLHPPLKVLGDGNGNKAQLYGRNRALIPSGDEP